jgi:SAM-dependent methyltransferase
MADFRGQAIHLRRRPTYTRDQASMPEPAMEGESRWSYSTIRMGTVHRLRDAYELAKMLARGPGGRVELTMRQFRATERRLRETFGYDLRGRKVLEIGPGQQLRNMRCLAIQNDVVGIDTDVVRQGFRLRDYVDMMRLNSGMRVAKTVGRKLLGFDRDFERELGRRLGVKRFQKLDVQRMNATRMAFPDRSFDFACSYSVFEHIDRPADAIAEVARVLRPGGVAYVSLHLYTSHSGAHDARIMGTDVLSPPYWPHLRPEHQHRVHPGAYCNEVRLAEWKSLFTASMPGVVFAHELHDELGAAADSLLAAQAIRGYTREELLTLNLIAMWRKPA